MVVVVAGGTMVVRAPLPPAEGRLVKDLFEMQCLTRPSTPVEGGVAAITGVLQLLAIVPLDLVEKAVDFHLAGHLQITTSLA